MIVMISLSTSKINKFSRIIHVWRSANDLKYSKKNVTFAKKMKPDLHNSEYYNAFPEGFLARQVSVDGHFDDREAYIESQNLFRSASSIEHQTLPKRWRCAKAILLLLEQLDDNFPTRNRRWDGIFADQTLCPAETDHCPTLVIDGLGIVAAVDITDDKESGCDLQSIVCELADSYDPRIKHIIFDRKIFRSYSTKNQYPENSWGAFNGKNPHNEHAHISLINDPYLADDKHPWKIGKG